MAHLQPKVPFWVFPCACWNPYYYSVLSLGMATKKDHFPKKKSCNENARFFTVWTQIVFAYFLKNDNFTKRTIFLHNHPKNTIILGFFWHFPFPFFHIVLFTFSNIRKTQTKSAFFFWKPIFWHPDKLPKFYFRAPTHYLCFFRPAKNTIKLGKHAKQNLGQIFNATLDRLSTQKGQILEDFQLYSMFIYIYI